MTSLRSYNCFNIIAYVYPDNIVKWNEAKWTPMMNQSFPESKADISVSTKESLEKVNGVRRLQTCQHAVWERKVSE